MNTFFKILGYIPRVACLGIIPLTLIFDLITLFKYKETEKLIDFIFN